RDITVRRSKKASEFAHYKAAINRLLRGDSNAMAPWHGRKIAGIALITDLPPIFSPGIMRLSPVLGSPTLHLQSHSHHRKKRFRPAEPCERSRTEPRSSAQTPLV